jgi:hypothetical protein
MTDDILVEVGHPLPVSRAGRGGNPRLGLVRIASSVRLRGVPPGSLAPLRAPETHRHQDGFAFEGRYWRELVSVRNPRNGVPRPLTSLETALAALREGAPDAPDAGLRAYAGSPLTAFEPPPGILSRPKRADRDAAEALPGLDALARRRIAELFATDVVHDGTGVYVAAPVPGYLDAGTPYSPGGATMAWTGPPPPSLAGAGPWVRLDRPEEAGAYQAGLGRRRGPDHARKAHRALMPTFDGLRYGNEDLSWFLNQAPSLLARIVASPPAFPDRRDPAGMRERTLALAPWIAMGLIGAIPEDEFPAVADAVEALARDLAVAWYPKGLDFRPHGGTAVKLRQIAIFVETVVRPRLAGPALSAMAEDEAAIAVLAPGR